MPPSAAPSDLSDECLSPQIFGMFLVGLVLFWCFFGLFLVVLVSFWFFCGFLGIFLVILGLLRFSVHGPGLDSSLKTWFWAKCALWQTGRYVSNFQRYGRKQLGAIGVGQSRC